MTQLKCRYDDNFQQATEYKEQALELIEKLKVAPTPVHFTLLYEYASRLDPDLATEIEDLLRNGYYNEQTARSIFRALLKETLEEYFPTAEIQAVIKNILLDLSHWAKTTSNVQEDFEDHLLCLAKCESRSEVETCINDNILPSMQVIQKNTSHLQARITNSSDVIEHLKLELEHATSLAKTDTLTGIANRRGYEEMINDQLALSNSEKQSFAMLILDIDHFKKINDSYGHLVGDSVLRYIARLLQSETKGQDSLARIGGEEFVILLNNISYDNAIIFAEKIRRMIADKAFKAKSHSNTLKLSVSIGVASYKAGEGKDEIFERADLALYQAKTNGRNQTCGEKEICNSSK